MYNATMENTSLQVLAAVAGFVSSGVGTFMLLSIEKYLDRLNENTVAVAVLTVEVHNLKKEFENFRTET